MLFKQKEKEKKYINPRFRAYGKARLDIARRAKTRQDWDQLWKGSTNPFPFTWGESWKHCVEYKVDDFAAEVGFFVDILGLPVNAFDTAYAMFTSPAGDFYIGIVPTPEKTDSTPKDAIRLQFMVKDILQTTKELERRGVLFEQQPRPCQPRSSLYIGFFRTPHGIPVDLWGYIGTEEDLDRDEELLEEVEGQDYNAANEVDDRDLDAFDIVELEEERLQLQIPLSDVSEEAGKEPQEQTIETLEDNISDNEQDELIEEDLQDKDELDEDELADEESEVEYFYDDDALDDWRIN
jgi:catechol 2,3-dioxygenase-like lactoylglutathione lyase family enzyme